MALTPFSPTVGGGSRSDGLILLMRNGRIVEDYGQGRVSEADYGVGFLAAITAALPFDTILVRGVTARINGVNIANKQHLTILGEEAYLKPNWAQGSPVGSYDWLWRLEFWHDSRIEGFVLDGEDLPNPAAVDKHGTLMTVTQCHRIKLKDIECSRNLNGRTAAVIGNSDPQVLYLDSAGIWLHYCDDLQLENYKSYHVGWAGMRIDSCNRLQVEDVYIEDPRNRAINLAGTENIDWVELQKVRCVAHQPTYSGNGVGFNVNIGSRGAGGRLGRLILKQYHAINKDIVGQTGYSYNDDAGLQMMKVHNVDRLEFDTVTMQHGANQINPLAPSIQIASALEGEACKEVIFKRVHTSGPLLFTYDNQLDFVHLDECEIAKRGIYGYWGRSQNSTGRASDMPIRGLYAKHAIIENSKLYSHNGHAFVALMQHNSRGSRLELKNNTYEAARTRTTISPVPPTAASTDPELSGPHYTHVSLVTRLGGKDVKGSTEGVKQFAGNIIQVGARMTNSGSDPLAFGNDEVEELLLTTDANGDLLFDPAKVGVGPGKHPKPWPTYVNDTTVYAGPGTDFFPSVYPPNLMGRRIRNVGYVSTATANTIRAMKGWICGPESTQTAIFSSSAGLVVTATSHGLVAGQVVTFHVTVKNTGSTVTFSAASGEQLVNVTGNPFSNNQVVAFDSGVGGELNPHLERGSGYWVKSSASGNFRIALTSAGTNVQTVTTYYGTAPQTVRRRELPETLQETRQYWVAADNLATNSFKLLPYLPTYLATPLVAVTDLGSGGTVVLRKGMWRREL